MTSPLRVQFAHGLESSPQGAKARLFAREFIAQTPAMNTQDFESCVAVHASLIAEFRPDVLVGSSFGGAVAVALLQRGSWRGPTLLLAQAAVHYRPDVCLPDGARVLLVHGRQDAVIPIEHSRQLARSGTPGLVELLEYDDDHSLTRLVASAQLVELVKRAATVRATH